MSAGHQPTEEQAAIIAAYRTGGNLVIEAGAGTGKTTVLKQCAAARPKARAVYVAYNRTIADEGRRSFPPNVSCSTAHALAMRAVGRHYRDRLNGPRVRAQEVAQILRINDPLKVGDLYLAPQQLARLVLETVERFCRSDAREIQAWHFPRKPGLDEDVVRRQLAAALLPFARKAWEDLQLTNGPGSAAIGRLRFDHGHYLKLFQFSDPRLDADVVMLDEAQDANPVILSVVLGQENSQLVAVGDRSQAINSWNGAIDAMDKFPGAALLPLSQSFRFGSQIAYEANKWLAVLGAQLRLTGHHRISSRLGAIATPDAILCRTNAKTIAEAMRLLSDGTSVAVVGGGKDIRALAEAAAQLKAGRGTAHPELYAFASWAQVQDHAENDPAGSDLKVFVKLIDEHGPDAIIAMVDRLADERRAQVTLSTAHKAKGREWGTVRIADDFRAPRADPENPDELKPIPPADAMLAYVAVTRAKLGLERSALAFVDRYLAAIAA